MSKSSDINYSTLSQIQVQHSKEVNMMYLVFYSVATDMIKLSENIESLMCFYYLY